MIIFFLFFNYTKPFSASSGLGEALAYQFYEQGYNLVLVARNESRLHEIKKDIVLMDLEQKKLDEEEAKANPSSMFIKSYSASDALINSLRPPASNLHSSVPNRVEIITSDLSNPLSPFQIMDELKERGIANKVC